jgi:hypothetical protein
LSKEKVKVDALIEEGDGNSCHSMYSDHPSLEDEKEEKKDTKKSFIKALPNLFRSSVKA